eukprot:TRINITY_DN18423_c0_g1_i1.p1 TRINITY_DN18423_c0_g1~~TRINITY_DN18423_c0_g1_i1.p1  ORF type:complete len:118 (-),score=36.78 TRINITY_DN18423_c0_g1_i1:267-620(-)
MATRRSPLALPLLGLGAGVLAFFGPFATFVLPTSGVAAAISAASAPGASLADSPTADLSSNIVLADGFDLGELGTSAIIFLILAFLAVTFLGVASIQSKKVIEKQNKFWEDYEGKFK